MPSSLNLNGLRIYRPGIYGVIDASNLGGSGISTGNVALVGAFPSLEQYEPWTFTSARAVRDFDPDDLTLQTNAKLAFSPSSDDRVPGGASTLTLVNIQGNTQAAYPGAKDANGADSITLKSKLWGKKGNQVFAAFGVNASDSTAIDVKIGKGSKTETYTALASGSVADFYYEGDGATSGLSTSTLSIDHAQLLWKWTKDLTWAGGGAQGGTQSQVFAMTDAIVENASTLHLTYTDGATVLVAGKTLQATVVGKDKTGAAVTGIATITYAEFNADPAVSKAVQFNAADVEWGEVTSIQFDADQGDIDGQMRLTGTAYDLDLTTFNYVGQVTSLIDNNSNKGFHATALHPRINKIPATEMDKQASINVANAAGASGNKLTVRCDVWAILQGLSSSQMVTATRAPSANLRPGPASLAGWAGEQFYFVGGSESATTTANYDSALAAILYSDIQIVVVMSDDVTVAQKLSAHCVLAAISGYERNGYFGCPADKTLTSAFTDYTSKINSRHVSLTGQEVYVEDASGALVWMTPTSLAIIMAGMQAGTSVATPLTWKRPALFNVRQKWDLNRDSNDAISKGLINISKDNLGFKVERSVTTWLEDDNPVYSEVSANESINTSVRDLRAQLNIRIGDAVYGNTPSKLKSVVESRLNQQVADGVIKAWRNVDMQDLGDTIKINYEVAAVEPLNFIQITASVVRIASA